MKFKIFCFIQLMGICFVGLLSVVRASPLDTIPPPITDFFISANQTAVEPLRNYGDFIGRVFAPKPEDWQTRPEAQPITGVTVTIASGSRAGESVATNPSGYYRFPNVRGDELHLRVEKEHFEPKEVRVHRSRPTILANGDVLNYKGDPQQHPGNILIGQRWPDEVRFIMEEILVVHDLLYVEGGRPPEGKDLGAFYSLGVIVLYSYQYADWADEVGLLGTFAHEIAHAHQHATVSVDGSAWEIHGWGDTPEGRAYEEAQRKDWQEVGKSRLDHIYGDRRGKGGVALTETAAETCAHYWSVDRWGGRTAYGFLEVEAPNRYKWAEKWVPINIAVRPPSTVVSIPDPNLAKAIRKTLGLGANARMTQRWMQRLTKLDARDSQIKDLTGLEHATRLSLLEVRQNQIRDIRPLANLKSLKKLILEGNQVRDISPLANMTQVTWLLLGGNPISDFTPLANLNQLEGLGLWGGNIGDVNLLANKTKLTHLWLDRNNIRDITPLANLVNLKDLYLRDNSIRDIRPLAELTKLEDLKLRGNPIQDMSPLRTLLNRNPNLDLDIQIPPPPPIVHVGAAQRPSIYWVNAEAGTLHRLVGAKVENLLPNVRNAMSLAVDMTDEKLYWVEKTGNRTGSIRRANLDGTNLQLVKDLTSVPLNIALDAASPTLYLATASGTIRSIPTEGSKKVSKILEDLVNPRSLVVSNGYLYWAESEGSIRRVNLTTTQMVAEDLATGRGEPVSLAIGNAKIYWLESDPNGGSLLQRANLDGSNIQHLKTFRGNLPTAITIDAAAKKLYWTKSAKIQRSNLAGKSITNVVSNLGSAVNIVLDTPIENGTASQGLIPDPKLAAALRSALGLGPNAPITKQAMQKLTEIHAREKKIRNLTGLEHAKKLRTLNLADNEISDLSPIAKLKQLRGISLFRNQISELRPLAELKQLTWLDIGGNQIKDITPLENLVKLDWLSLWENQIKNLRPLVRLTQLSRLDLRKNQIRNVSPLARLVNLDALYLESNPIADLAPLRRLKVKNPEMELDIDINADAPAAPRAPTPPVETALLPNYPNPFNPETWIPYQLAKPAEVTLTIYAVDGRLIRTLVLGHQPAGVYQVRSRAAYWNGRNNVGEPVASGVYFYTLTAGNFTATRKMLILK